VFKCLDLLLVVALFCVVVVVVVVFVVTNFAEYWLVLLKWLERERISIISAFCIVSCLGLFVVAVFSRREGGEFCVVSKKKQNEHCFVFKCLDLFVAVVVRSCCWEQQKRYGFSVKNFADYWSVLLKSLEREKHIYEHFVLCLLYLFVAFVAVQ
jgi:hypothetical protein